MIPEGHTIEDIKKREQIIREFTESGKKKSISNEMLNVMRDAIISLKLPLQILSF